jgi:hypothetical protein
LTRLGSGLKTLFNLMQAGELPFFAEDAEIYDDVTRKRGLADALGASLEPLLLASGEGQHTNREVVDSVTTHVVMYRRLRCGDQPSLAASGRSRPGSALPSL